MDLNGTHILVVDDDLSMREFLELMLSREGYEVSCAENGILANQLIEKNNYDLILCDIRLGDISGLEVLRRAKAISPTSIVIMISAYATAENAVEAMNDGAYDYLPKPFNNQELKQTITKALELRTLPDEKKSIDDELKKSFHFDLLVGNSPRMQHIYEVIKQISRTKTNVLISGESGTGKELISRAVHANSSRKDKVFFAVDCGTLSDNLLESELFGYAKGAFTGAYNHKEGIFKLADGGTVFLDEISNISLNVQSKLLRFIENREILPLGSTINRKVDVRLIFATNKDLKEMVVQGSFREDFYYRIFVYPILVPPLRERKTDILPISYHFLKQFNQSFGKRISGFEDKAVTRLTEYDWPGNVRQLRNVIERAVILCERDKIMLKELPLLGDIADIEQLIDYIPSTNDELKKIKKEIRQKAVTKVEKNFVMNALIKNDWNVTRAAEKVGLQRTNFQSLIKKHHIKIPRHTRSDS